MLIQFTCKSFKLSNIIYGHPIIYSDHCGSDKGHFASSMMWHLSYIYVLHWSICWECNEDGRVQRQARMLCKMWHLQTCFLECTQFSQDRLHTMELWEILKPLSTLLCWFRNGLTTTTRWQLLWQSYTSEATLLIFSEKSTQFLFFSGNSERMMSQCT